MMKRNYLSILAAFAVGLAVPCLVLGLHTCFTQPQEQNSTETPQISAQAAKKIEIVDKQGNAGEMELEEYLVGVILAEMPTSYEHDALCAQAIVARTYAVKRQKEQRHTAGGVCFDPGCCQAYVSEAEYLNGLGYQEDIEIAKKAVQDTEGLVLTYEGAPIEATYFSCSGGKTEDAVAVWGAAYPYLLSVMSPGEEEMENYRAQVRFTRKEFEKSLGISLSGMPEQWMSTATYTSGGGVETIKIADVTFTGRQLRSILKLNSTAFIMEQEGDDILITTFGKGHRVGMSQSGAQAMALRGYGYETILTYYYPGTAIDKLANIR